MQTNKLGWGVKWYLPAASDTPHRKNEGRADLSSVMAPLLKQNQCREKMLEIQSSVRDNKVFIQMLLYAAGVTLFRRNF